MMALLHMRMILRWCYMIFNHFYVLPAYFGWMMFFLPLKYVHPMLFWNIEGYLYQWTLLIVTSWIQLTRGYKVILHGEDLTALSNEASLVLVNHQDYMDVPTLFDFVSSFPSGLRNVTWVQDIMFKYMQFGWVSLVHGDYFIKQGKSTRQTELDDFGKFLQSTFSQRRRRWLVLFPEGGFFHKRKESSMRYAEKNGFPVLHNITLPRMGAINCALDSLSQLPSDLPTIDGRPADKLTRLIDVTIAYPGGSPVYMWDVVSDVKTSQQVHVYCRSYKLSDIPTDMEQRQQWIYQRFREKDEMLSKFYREHVFTADDTTRGHVTAGIGPSWMYYTLHLGFMLATYCIYSIWCCIFSVFW